MDTSGNLETRLTQSLDDLIKQQQTARKKDSDRQGRTKTKKVKVKSTKVVKVAPKVLKATGGVSKAGAGRRLGGRKAPLQVAATTKTKITQARKASTGGAGKAPGLNVQLNTAADAVAAVKAMKPVFEKAKKLIAAETQGKKQGAKGAKAAKAKASGRRVNTDVVMQGQGGGSGRRSRSGNRKK